MTVGAWIALNWHRWPPPPTPVAYGPGVTAYEFPHERFTAADVGAYARGERADGRLLRALSFPDISEHVSIEVAFVPPAGSVTEFKRYGWPTHWLVYRWDGEYADVYAREQAVDRPATLLMRWSGLRYFSSTVEPDGRRRVRMIVPRAVVAPLVVLFVAWQVGRGIGALLTRDAGRRRRIGRRAALVCMGAAGAALAVVSLRAEVKTHISLRLGVRTVAPVMCSTGLTAGDVLALRQQPGGEAKLASSIQQSGAVDSASPAVALLIGIGANQRMEQRSMFTGWPPGLLAISHVEPAGSSPSRLVLRRVRVAEGGLSLMFADAAGRGVRRHVTVSLTSLFEAAALLIIVWHFAGLLSLGMRGWRRRREARRIARGLCAGCGYEVG